MDRVLVAAAITVAMGSVQAATITGEGSSGDAFDPLDEVIGKLAFDGVEVAGSPGPATGAADLREYGSVRMSAPVAGPAFAPSPASENPVGGTDARVPVPVPATAALLGIGLVAVGLIRRKAR